MAAIRCKKTLVTSGSHMFVYALIVEGKHIGLGKSLEKPVPVVAGTYPLVWELKGSIGDSVELEITADGKVIQVLPKQTITSGVRIGSGGPKSPNYKPLMVVVP